MNRPNNVNHTEKNLLKVLSQDLFDIDKPSPKKMFAEDTNSVDDSDEDLEDGNFLIFVDLNFTIDNIILLQKPQESSTSIPPGPFSGEDSFFSPSVTKKPNLQSKEDIKKLPFLNTL